MRAEFLFYVLRDRLDSDIKLHSVCSTHGFLPYREERVVIDVGVRGLKGEEEEEEESSCLSHSCL